jgi:hypothetical protein
MQSNHVLCVHAQMRGEDKAYSRSFLHDGAIEIHRPYLMLDRCRRSLDFCPFSDKVSQYLRLDGATWCICYILPYQLEGPLGYPFLVLRFWITSPNGYLDTTVMGCTSK